MENIYCPASSPAGTSGAPSSSPSQLLGLWPLLPAPCPPPLLCPPCPQHHNPPRQPPAGGECQGPGQDGGLHPCRWMARKSPQTTFQLGFCNWRVSFSWYVKRHLLFWYLLFTFILIFTFLIFTFYFHFDIYFSLSFWYLLFWYLLFWYLLFTFILIFTSAIEEFPSHGSYVKRHFDIYFFDIYFLLSFWHLLLQLKTFLLMVFKDTFSYFFLSNKKGKISINASNSCNARYDYNPRPNT